MSKNNKNFLNWTNEYKKQIKELNKNKERTLQIEFTNTYPDLLFSNLKIQNNYYSSKDGFVHYMDTSTNKIYSWCSFNKIWIEYDNKYQESLLDLFE